MNLQLHPKHGVAPVMEICKLSGFATGNIILLGASCEKYLDKYGDLPRFVVTGNIHPKIHEVLQQGGVCVIGPKTFDCVLISARGAKEIFEERVRGRVVEVDEAEWSQLLATLPKRPHSTDGSHVGKDFPTFGEVNPSAETLDGSEQERIDDTPETEDEPSKEDE